MPDLYFNRVPSLPTTDDGSARPLTEDLITGSGDGEDITWDADTTGTDEVPEKARAEAGPDGEAECTEADVALLSAPPGTNRGSRKERDVGLGTLRFAVRPGFGSGLLGYLVRAGCIGIPGDVLAVARARDQVLGKWPRAPVVGGG